ncbi:UNVERIFIED_CONTAM: lycopene cyclase, partial [Salmonella enterica subsp. enterica serovar Weltevreden]
TVPQLDGYRFLYALPFGPRTLLVEDTYFSDGEDLAPDTVRQRALDYAAQQGWQVSGIAREEVGILPMALSGDIDVLWGEATPGVAL